MRKGLTLTALACAVAFASLASSADAQTPPPAQAATGALAAASIVVEKPTYMSIPLEITVNRPAAEVWKVLAGKECCRRPSAA